MFLFVNGVFWAFSFGWLFFWWYGGLLLGVIVGNYGSFGLVCAFFSFLLWA